MKEQIIEKFTQILASVPAEQQVALAVELAKMMPADENADVDWSASWGYSLTKEEVGVSIWLKITPSIQSKQVMSLNERLANMIDMGKEAQFSNLKEALEIVLAHIITNHRMTYSPALYLTETIAAIHLRFWGEPSEEAKIFGEEQRKVLKTQKETACL